MPPAAWQTGCVAAAAIALLALLPYARTQLGCRLLGNRSHAACVALHTWQQLPAGASAQAPAHSDRPPTTARPSCAARERIIGWYHTGPRLREADIDISELIGRYCDNPLLVICEVQVRHWAGVVHWLQQDGGVAWGALAAAGCVLVVWFSTPCCAGNVICPPARLQPKEMGLPVHAYVAKEEIREDGTEKSKKVGAGSRCGGMGG